MDTEEQNLMGEPSQVIRFNKLTGQLEKPTILLKTRSGKIIDELQYTNLSLSFVAKGLDNLAFDVHKVVNGRECECWDKLIELSIIDYVGYGQFECHVPTRDDIETIKTCTCESLETELGQHIIRDMHINDEDAIIYGRKVGNENLDFDSTGTFIPTVLYDEDDEDHSLLNRVLKEKTPHWTVGYVSSKFAVNGCVYDANQIQRTFTIDGTSPYDFFDGEVSKEFGCVFTYDTYNRKVNCYNLEDCVYNKSTNEIIEGYYYLDSKYYDENNNEIVDTSNLGHCEGIGEDTTIFMSKSKLANSFSLDSDIGSIKNCFYVSGGDDEITNIVAAANITGNNYIYLFSNFQYDDMSDELVSKIKEYSSTLADKEEEFNKVGGVYVHNDIDYKYDTEKKAVVDKNGRIIVNSKYVNGKIYVLDTLAYYKNDKCYNREGVELPISEAIYDEPGLYTEYTSLIDRINYWEHTRFPNVDPSDTTAKDEKDKIIKHFETDENPIYIQNGCTSTSFAHVTSNIESMIGVICDNRYTVKILKDDSHIITCDTIDKENITGYWNGTISLVRDTNEKDTIDFSLKVNIILVYGDIDKSIGFCKQKMDIAIAKMDIVELDFTKLTDGQLNELISQYNLSSVKSFMEGFDSCRSTLDDLYANMGIENSQIPPSDTMLLSREKYTTRYDIAKSIYDNLFERIENMKSEKDVLYEQIQAFRESLDMETFFGETLWKEFRSYVREDEYNNGNYISDGLSNTEILEKAKELLNVAKKELSKACMIQHTISGDLNNIFSLEEKEKLHNKFSMFNYVRAQVDDKIYKLRLMDISFTEDTPEKLDVVFSEQIESICGLKSDKQKILEQSQAIATTYSSTTKQAKQGATAMSNFNTLKQEGLDSSLYLIKNSNTEEVTFGNTGLSCKSMLDNGIYSPYEVRVTHNGIYMSENNFNSVKTALGRFKYNDKWVYGLCTDVLFGDLIIGEKMLISNKNGSVSITGDGIYITNGKIQWSTDGSDGVQTPSIEHIDGLDDYLEQLDGRIQTFSQTTDPSIDWTTTALKEQHSGDIWINPNNGLTKQWTGTKWVEITDSELKKLAESKAQIFTSEPKPPYCVGDLLIPDKDIKSGTKTYYAKKVYKYDGTNWTEINYTDDTKADTVDTKIGYFQQNVNKLLNADLPTTEIGSDYVFSPYIGGGYLYIKGDNGSVEINPKLITGYTGRSGDIFNIKSSNDTSVFNVNTNGQVTIRGGNSSSSIQLDGTNGSIYTTNGSSKSILASGYLYSTDGTYTAYLNNAGLDFKKDDICYARFSSGYWIGTKTRGVSIHSYADSKFISFGNKTDNSQDVWTTPIVLNYGLNPYKDRNDPSQGTIDKDVIIFGTTYHNSNVYFNNDSYVGSSSSTYNGIYVSDAIKAPRVYAGNYVHGDYALDVNGESYFGNKITLNAGTYLNGLTGGGIYCSGKFFIEGDLTVNGIGVIKQLSDGGHSISIGWNGSALDILVDSTHMYPAMSGHNLWTHDITWTDSGNARTNPSLTSSVYNLACVQYVKDNFTAKSSDERVKCNFNALPPLLDTVFDNLKVQEYEYKDGLGKQGKFWGETAQHVNCILEQNNLKNCAIVGQRKVDYDNGEDIYIKDGIFHYIDTDNVTWLCVDQIQKLKKRVSELELELQQLKQNN